MTHLLRVGFCTSPKETTFARCGFRGNNVEARRRLERVGRTFPLGYHAALDVDQPENLALRLNAIDPKFRGFAFEVAAMGLTLLDHQLSLRRQDRIKALLEGAGESHSYVIHVGAGWAFARLPRHVECASRRMYPLLRWLAVDGYGFHEGYFRWRRYLRGRATPAHLSGYGRRVFGLVELGHEPARINTS
jgi:enediyne biosynthesis protein E3